MKKNIFILFLIPLILGISNVYADDVLNEKFFKAIEDNNLNLVKELVAKGVEINKANNEGWTPLHAAAQNGHLDIVKYLINKGANLKEKNRNGETALSLAKKNGFDEIVNYLATNGTVKSGNSSSTNYDSSSIGKSNLASLIRVDNFKLDGMDNSSSIYKVNQMTIYFENFSSAHIKDITIFVTIRDYYHSNKIVYKKMHNIKIDIYPNELVACEPFYLANEITLTKPEPKPGSWGYNPLEKFSVDIEVLSAY